VVSQQTKCHLCGDGLNTTERYYAIFTGKLSRISTVTIYFHPTCFEEIAGDEYITALADPK